LKYNLFSYSFYFTDIIIINNMCWLKILLISVVAVFLTLIFLMIPNKSNFPNRIIIPLIVSLIIKYSMGDLDRGYSWTMSDLLYWAIILLLPYFVLVYIDR
jgi:hypothetical protein